MDCTSEEKETVAPSSARKPFEELVRIGKSVTVHNETLHIRAIVDKRRVIYRVWSTDLNGWQYINEEMESLRKLYDEGNLTDG